MGNFWRSAVTNTEQIWSMCAVCCVLLNCAVGFCRVRDWGFHIGENLVYDLGGCYAV